MTAAAIFGDLFAAWLFGFSALISIINPPAGALIFHGMTRWLTEQERSRLARSIAINSFVVLLGALFLGAPILGFAALVVIFLIQHLPAGDRDRQAACDP